MTTQTNLKSRITRLLDHSIARTTSRGSFLRAVVAFAIAITAIGIAGPLRSSAQTRPVYKVGVDVSSPRVLYRVDPQYTEEARADKISGSVMLSIVVGPDGHAYDINVVKSLDPGLDRNAALAVQEWRFQPGVRDGEAVAVRASIEVNYRLQ
jgi:TonB family protein